MKYPSKKLSAFILSLTALFTASNLFAQGPKPVLVTDGPSARLNVGPNNTAKCNVYNSQQLGAIRLHDGIELILKVTGPDGKTDTYKGRTKNNILLTGGQPPTKEYANFTGINIKKPGAHVLTCIVPKDTDPPRWIVHQQRGSKSNSLNAGGGAAAAGKYDLLLKLKNPNNTPGRAHWTYLKTPDGTEIDRKRSDGKGEVRFPRVAPLAKPYLIEIKQGNIVKWKFQHVKKAQDEIVTYVLK